MSDRGRRPGMGRGRRSPVPPYGDRGGRDKGRDFHGFDRDGRDRSPIRGDGFRDGIRKDDRPYPRRDDRFRDDGFLPPGGGGTSNYDDPFARKRYENEPYFDKGRLDEPFKPRGGDPFTDSYKDPYRDMMDPRRPNDCEIIVVNKQQRTYAEAVERRLKNIGMMVDLLFLKDEVLLTQTIDDISRRGSLYAVVVTQQHEAHGSVTLNILHGTPQEHRNMPLDDALRLVARNFHEYVQAQREKVRDPVEGVYGVPTPLDREVQYLLNLLADGKYLSLPELDRVIRYLQERRDRMAAAEGTAKPLASAAPIGSDLPVKPPEDDRAKPQDIQQRILNIINQPPSSSPGQQGVGMQSQGYGLQQPTAAPQDIQPPPPQQQPSSTFLNFDNPNVKKALDSLIQSGPNLLKSIGMGSNPGGSGGPQLGSTQGGGGLGTASMAGSAHQNTLPMGNTGMNQGGMMGYGGSGGGNQGYMNQPVSGSGGMRHPMMGSPGGMMGRGMMSGPRRY